MSLFFRVPVLECLLHQDVAVWRDMLVAVVSKNNCLVSADVAIIHVVSASCSSKAKSWIASNAVVLVVGENSYSRLGWNGPIGRGIQIKAFHVAISLKRGPSQQWFPSIASKIGWFVCAVSQQRMQWRSACNQLWSISCCCLISFQGTVCWMECSSR